MRSASGVNRLSVIPAYAAFCHTGLTLLSQVIMRYVEQTCTSTLAAEKQSSVLVARDVK